MKEGYYIQRKRRTGGRWETFCGPGTIEQCEGFIGYSRDIENLKGFEYRIVEMKVIEVRREPKEKKCTACR